MPKTRSVWSLASIAGISLRESIVAKPRSLCDVASMAWIAPAAPRDGREDERRPRCRP